MPEDHPRKKEPVSETLNITVIGAGSIGVAFAIVFARAKHRVKLYDQDSRRLALVPSEIETRLKELAEFGLISEPPSQIIERISLFETIEPAVYGASLVQECVPERLDLKQAIFAQLDFLLPAETILASSSSALPASSFAAGLKGQARCLVAHPGNPPYLIPIIEIVGASFTDAAIVNRAMTIFRAAGLQPIRVAKEVEGFVFNRLQGALLREAYCLVRDGVATVEDIDLLVRNGLGFRWSVVGPFETTDLNTRGGIASHAAKMGPAYARMGAERGQNDPWTAELVAAVSAARRRALPLDQWEAGVARRDRKLMQLLHWHKQNSI